MLGAVEGPRIAVFSHKQRLVSQPGSRDAPLCAATVSHMLIWHNDSRLSSCNRCVGPLERVAEESIDPMHMHS